MPRLCPWVLVAGLCGAGDAPSDSAWAHPVKEAPTLQCFSAAVVTRWGAEYLRVAYFVDPEGLARRGGIPPLAWIREGRGWSGSRLAFRREISAARRRDTFLEQFRLFWPGGRFDPQRPSIQDFLRRVDRPLRRGDRLDYLFDPGGTLWWRHGDEPWEAVHDPALVEAFLCLTFVGDARNAAAVQAMSRDLEAFVARRPVGRLAPGG